MFRLKTPQLIPVAVNPSEPQTVSALTISVSALSGVIEDFCPNN